MMINTLLFLFTAGVVWLVFSLVPPAIGLGHLVRLIFFHIPTAWVSVLAFLLSAWWAFRYLRNRRLENDYFSYRSALLGFFFCLLATVSGAIFAKLTWGTYWNWDPRQITIFILLLLYGAYFALRTSIPEQEKKAKLSAIYSLFSCLTIPFLVFVIPRYYFSLHPEPVINASGHIEMNRIMLYVLLASLINVTLIFFRLLFSRRISL
ncbi:Cytochrome c biogenesis protein CcsA [Sporomusa acidovorans DSM 3132]|uniref:Heme exporter protein C n=2 Tax=Sporomusa TaxID=2375 RepID=A0ABZ3J0M3_SPOA4|nr:heme exporter protein C [Sporomusa acidovorans DSM 3132]SDE55447.1 heme exporter protein C [Sporomusa acidovorans]